MRYRRWLKTLIAVLAAGVTWLSVVSWEVVHFGETDHAHAADCAIVLGAAVSAGRPTPVLEERVRHGVTLYRRGVVKKLIFTGGVGYGDTKAESEASRDFAATLGVPLQDMLIETRSGTTRENLVEASALMRSAGLTTAVLVSDPLHLKRASVLAGDLGLDAVTSPTPTTRYRSWRTQAGFLLRELYFLHGHALTGR